MLHSYIIQIHTGSFRRASEPVDAMQEKLRALLAALPCHSVIMGWNTDAGLNRRLLELIHSFSLPCFYGSRRWRRRRG